MPLTLYPVVIPCPPQTTLNVLDKKVERLVVNVPQMVIRYLPLRDFWLDSFGTTQVRPLSPVPVPCPLSHVIDPPRALSSHLCVTHSRRHFLTFMQCTFSHWDRW